MDAEAYLSIRLNQLGRIYIKKMFGWFCIKMGSNFFGGYKIIDDSVLILFLILSPKAYKQAIDGTSFEKFNFGKTWVEIEINSEEDIDNIWPFVEDAFIFTKIRKNKKS